VTMREPSWAVDLPVNDRARGMITEYGLSSVPTQSALKVRNEPTVMRSKPTEEPPELVDEWVPQRPEADDDDVIEVPEFVARPAAEDEDELVPESIADGGGAEEEIEVPAVERTRVEAEEPDVAEFPREEPVESVPERPEAVMREETEEPVADVEAVRRHAKDDTDEAELEHVARPRAAAVEPMPEPVGSVVGTTLREEDEAVAVEPVERSREPEAAADDELLSPIARANAVDEAVSGMPGAPDTGITGIAGRMSGQERRKLRQIEAAIQRRRERDLQVEAGR